MEISPTDTRASPEQGLLLNGKSIKLTGGSVHHDNGPLGAAAFDRAEERKVELLKAAGHNAVRTAHNPPSPAFLDACDRLGLLVLDEPFDTWKVGKLKFDYGRDFDEWWQRDLTAMVLRDRNHPSIAIWGIGNEIPEAYVERGGTLAKQLAAQVRSLDSSRPITQAFPGATSGPTHEAVFASLGYPPGHICAVGTQQRVGRDYPFQKLIGRAVGGIDEPEAVVFTVHASGNGFVQPGEPVRSLPAGTSPRGPVRNGDPSFFTHHLRSAGESVSGIGVLRCRTYKKFYNSLLSQ